MNILVTSIGEAFAADIVIKRLHANQHMIVGCDRLPKEWIADALNVDYFAQSPRALDREQYLDFIIRICHKYHIQLIMPLSDLDIDAIIDARQWFQGKGACVCTPDIEVTKLCRDKYKLTKFLEGADICPTIPAMLLSEARHTEFRYPLLAKPRFGHGSEGINIIRSAIEFQYLRLVTNNMDYLLQPFIEGNILNVDVIRTHGDDIVCVARRDLVRHPAGVGTAVEIIENTNLTDICSRIAKALNIIGAANFEFIEAPDQIYFMEINPRLSGGVAFSHMAGYDFVTNHLRCFTGRAIEVNPIIRKMIIARRYEEYITRRL